MGINKLLRIAIIGTGLFGIGYCAGSPKTIIPRHLNNDGIADAVVENNLGRINPYYGTLNNPSIDINKSRVSEDSVLGYASKKLSKFKEYCTESRFQGNTESTPKPVYKRKKTDSLFK